MKIKLNVFGDLFIERKKTMKPQFCPYQGIIYKEGRPEMIPCGEWCPLFSVEDGGELPTVLIELCDKAYIVEKKDFTDERDLT